MGEKVKLYLAGSSKSIFLPITKFLPPDWKKWIREGKVKEVEVYSIYNWIDGTLELTVRLPRPGRCLYYYEGDEGVIFEVLETDEGEIIATKIYTGRERSEARSKFSPESVLEIIDEMIEHHEHMIDGFSSADKVFIEGIKKLQEIKEYIKEKYKKKKG